MIEIPEYIKQETWAAFCEMRRLKGRDAPWTERAARRTLGKLAEFHRQGYDADWLLGRILVLDHCTPTPDQDAGARGMSSKSHAAPELSTVFAGSRSFGNPLPRRPAVVS